MLLHSAGYVFAVQICIICTPVLANGRAGIEGNSAAGAWNQWTSWITCSAECRTGITVRSRTCQPSLMPLLSSGDDTKVRCPGTEKEVKLCNKQECSEGKRGWREEECAKYDSSVHSGRRYTWEPFTHPADPCSLTCRAKGHHFYSNLADRVPDGTPCGGATTNPTAVCVQGVCEEVGCDDIVGSPWRQDVCGVCRGDNSSCRTLTGVFSQQDLDPGMNQIVVIPAGSTLLNITGLRYSINWLALQKEDGDYILNGGEIKSPAGDYEAAGTMFSYKTSQECSGQCITARGPIKEAVTLMLNTRGTNRGVQYSFNAPYDVTQADVQPVLGPSEPNVTLRETSSPSGDIGVDDSEGEEEVLIDEAENGHFDDTTAVSINELVDPESAASEKEKEGEEEEEEEEGEEEEEEEGEEEEEEEGEEEEEEEESHHHQQQQHLDQFSEVSEDEDLYLDNGEETTVPNDASDEEPDMEIDEDSESDAVSSNSDSSDLSNSEDSMETPADETDSDDMTIEDDDDEKENEEDEEEDVESRDSDLPLDDDEVGAPEPLQHPEPRDNKLKILQKAKPEFIDSEDTGQGSLTAGIHHSERQSSIERGPSVDDLSTPQGVHTADPQTPDLTTGPAVKESTQTETTPSANQTVTEDTSPTMEHTTAKTTPTQDSRNRTPAPTISDQPQSDSGVTHKHTLPPARSLAPQKDSPTRPNTPREPSSRSSRPRSRQRFRRPSYSQSFTFRRRFRQRAQGRNKRPSRHGGRSRSGSHLEQPRIMTSRTNVPAYNTRRIKFRTPPQRQSSQRQTSGSFTGYKQPYISRTPYKRTQSHRYYGRHTPSQRQALTLGQSASRDRDELPTVQISNRASQGRASAPDHNARLEGQRRRQQENSRQREYARQQEEYRRELQRRRQQMEQQRASQKAEYQRRLEEHNRRLRQRQLEQQRRHHNRRRHDHRRHRNRHGEQHGHPTQQPNVRLSGPSSGIVSRVNRTESGASPQRSRGSDARQRPRVTPSGLDPSWTRSPMEERTGSPRSEVNERQQPGTASPVARTTTPTTTTEPAGKPGSRLHTVPSTLAQTRDFLTNPGEQTTSPTIPALLPNRPLGGRGPDPPHFIPEDSRHDSRSSLSGPASNELPSNVLTPLVIGPEGNVVPTVNERGLVIGAEGSLSAREGGERKMSYEWRVSGLTECTLTCGGGVQQAAVVCLDTRTQAVVTNGNCAHLQRPEIKAVTCNTRPCPAEWHSNQWSPCSVSCGPGEQTRLVTCTARISPTLNLTRPEENCQGQAKPEARRRCQTGPCSAWKTGNWSACSVQCGEGVRTRDVFCADQTGFDISDDLCSGSKPRAEEACEMGPCGKGWYYTQWPGQCPAKCGTGVMNRRVACLGEGGQPLPESSCHEVTRPDPHQPCKAAAPCGGQWFTGQWEQCNVTCGRGNKNREVLCMKSLPGGLLTVVGDENCAVLNKPETSEPCELDACAVEWYMTSWTKCSQSCGTGHRTREVKCLDPQQRHSSDCPLAEKPRTREACNTNKCIARPPPSVGSDCQDSFSRCEIVRHARMCRYPYYKKKCCATCAEDT